MYGRYRWPMWTRWLQEICVVFKMFALCWYFLRLVQRGQNELFAVVHSDMHDKASVYFLQAKPIVLLQLVLHFTRLEWDKPIQGRSS